MAAKQCRVARPAWHLPARAEPTHLVAWTSSLFVQTKSLPLAFKRRESTVFPEVGAAIGTSIPATNSTPSSIPASGHLPKALRTGSILLGSGSRIRTSGTRRPPPSAARPRRSPPCRVAQRLQSASPSNSSCRAAFVGLRSSPRGAEPCQPRLRPQQPRRRLAPRPCRSRSTVSAAGAVPVVALPPRDRSKVLRRLHSIPHPLPQRAAPNRAFFLNHGRVSCRHPDAICSSSGEPRFPLSQFTGA
ncbi:hypothetical protein PR202_gb25706 [Eleusine coracana subsp. coracana]|uniref:Uncharacterized protein n=1 Tax=Eleusine coracana subsp. coracana TaxID=191504 RepID=A0AAV5FQU2_ELECO|nr:hypothetical protein PR202_gb25706 [Eleusine coracana subsp. coracana]